MKRRMRMSRTINPPIYILAIETNTGHTNFHLCETEKAAVKQLFGYVRRWWFVELNQLPPKEITWQLVGYYKERTGESFIITPEYEILDEDDEPVHLFDMEEEDDIEEFIGYSREEELGE
jgi:hypothetical protein